jgi:hypothetical protein
MPTVLPFPVEQHFMIGYKHQILLTGGCSRAFECFDQFQSFDTHILKWTTMPPMVAARAMHRAIVHHDKLIVIGGWSTAFTDPECGEVFSFATQQWTAFPARSRMSFAMAIHNNLLFVMGGNTGQGELIREADVYDVSEDKGVPELVRTFQMPFIDKRLNDSGDCGAAVFDGKIYVFQPRGVLVHDIASGTWTSRELFKKGQGIHKYVQRPVCFVMDSNPSLFDIC